ncbi:MAG: hypothetical protein ACK5OB_13955 [Pirellula sp.]
MQIIQHVGCNFDAESRAELDRIGINVSLGIDAFDIDESDPRWDLLQPWLARRRPVVTTKTLFSDAELGSASYLQMVASWHHGFPMPDWDDGYLECTYDTSRMCPECGIGAAQKSPFRMKAEPKWGKRDILQLNWVFDAFFVTTRAYETVLLPFGIECEQVLDHKSGRPLRSVVQIVIDNVSDGRLCLEDSCKDVCNKCGQWKFRPHHRGFFPRLIQGRPLSIFRTEECFGSGRSAWNAIIVSADLYRAIAKSAPNGVAFYPLAV